MYDLIILGGGPAGYLAAERAGHAGLSVCLVEKRAVGGVCLNEGCIPSKTLLHSAKLYDYAREAGRKYGVMATDASLDYPAVIARKNKVVKTLVAGIEAKLKALSVEVVRASGVLEGRCDGGFRVRAGERTLEASQLLLATGSEPILPPIPGLNEAVGSGFAMTNREILDLKEIPERLVIVGGGVIGLEMASVFNSAGSQVTVVEMLPKLAGPTDADISAMLQKFYAKKGVTFVLEAKVTGFSATGLTYEKGGETLTLPADKILVSIGRRAVTAGIGLETLGVYTERGAIVTDDRMKTNVPGVYAAGDCNGKSMLAHTAYREAEVAVANMLGNAERMTYSAIPSVIYTNPEAAGVGETLETARAKGLDAREVSLSMRYAGRFIAENEGGDGICKLVLVGERVIGAHMLGNPSSEIISTAALAISREVPLSAFKKTVFPHPTVAEILREVAWEA